MDFDYAIIGGGPAGYTAGMFLAKKGYKVVIFEKNKLGGACLNYGCIPTKSLLHASEIYQQTINAADYGFDIEVKSFDFSKVAQKRDLTVEKVRKSLELAVKNSGVEVIYAEASVIDEKTISADGKEHSVNNIIVATGSEPRELKGLEFDGKFILSSDDVLKLDKLPKTVLIIGSGAIGIEWARIFSNFGVEVHIAEMAEHLLPMADIEVSKRIERIFKQKKIKFYLNDCVENIDKANVTLKSGAVISPDFILSAAGREPVRQEIENVTYLGDASKEIQLAHYAIHQAKQFALGIECNKALIPAVIYGEPEVAWVGKREQDCNDDCEKITLPISALGKAWCDDSTEGFIKLIVKDDYIVGAHIVSKEASALIHEILIAMLNNIPVNDLKKVCFAHPTYSEGVAEAISRI